MAENLVVTLAQRAKESIAQLIYGCDECRIERKGLTFRINAEDGNDFSNIYNLVNIPFGGYEAFLDKIDSKDKFFEMRKKETLKIINQMYERNKCLVFGYGTFFNMHLRNTTMQPARLHKYKRLFSKKSLSEDGTPRYKRNYPFLIKGTEEDYVDGVVIEINFDQLKEMDWYEGYINGNPTNLYNRVNAIIRKIDENGKEIENEDEFLCVYTYIVSDNTLERIIKEEKEHPGTYDFQNDSWIDYINLNKDYINFLEKFPYFKN